MLLILQKRGAISAADRHRHPCIPLVGHIGQPAFPRLQRERVFVERLPLSRECDLNIAQRRNRIDTNGKLPAVTYQAKRELRTGVLHHPKFAIGQEVLHEDFLFVRRKPGKVRLVIGEDAGHQFDIRAVVIGEITIPGNAKITVSPGPLLFARRYVVIGDVQQSAAFAVMPRANKVIV